MGNQWPVIVRRQKPGLYNKQSDRYHVHELLPFAELVLS